MDHFVRHLAMILSVTPLLCGVGAASIKITSLLCSWVPMRFCQQREPEGGCKAEKRKATFLFAVHACQHHSGPTASHQQQFKPVCSIPTLAKSTSLHLTLWRHQAYLLVASSKIWVSDLLASPPSSETGAPPARRHPAQAELQCHRTPTPSFISSCFLPALPLGHLWSGLSSTDDVRGM